MSRALLDAHVPGWEALSPLEFRWAINGCLPLLRVDLRAARSAIDGIPPQPALTAAPEQPPAKAERKAEHKAARPPPSPSRRPAAPPAE
jgi:hypothetical protein